MTRQFSSWIATALALLMAAQAPAYAWTLLLHGPIGKATLYGPLTSRAR
jgi:hypothetical protein